MIVVCVNDDSKLHSAQNYKIQCLFIFVTKLQHLAYITHTYVQIQTV